MAGTYTNLLYHLVFSTKNRMPLISQSLQQDLYSYIGGNPFRMSSGRCSRSIELIRRSDISGTDCVPSPLRGSLNYWGNSVGGLAPTATYLGPFGAIAQIRVGGMLH